MMKYFLKIEEFFDGEFSLKKASVLIAVISVIAKIFGLAKEMILASVIGPGNVLDIYNASFRIPDFIFNLLVLGTLSAAFVPVFSEYLLKDKTKALKLATTVLLVMTTVMVVLMVVVHLFAFKFIEFLAPGFSFENKTEAALLLRIMVVSPIIFTISSVLAGVIQSYKRFFITSTAPILYNIGIIFGILFLYPRYGIQGLAFGVVIGAGLYLLLHLLSLYARGFELRYPLSVFDDAFKKVIVLYLPRIIGLDIGQVFLLIATYFASSLSSGSLSILNLAYNLETVPLGIVGVSTAVAAFPALSQAHAKKDETEFVRIFERGVVQVLFVVVPISLLTLVMRAFIVRILFGRGQFTWEDTITTFSLLGVFSFAMIAQSLSPLLVRAFYAKQNTVIPVIINVVSILLITLLSYFWVAKIGVLGLALAFTVTMIFGATMLLVFIRSFIDRRLQAELTSKLFFAVSKIFIASVFAAAVAYFGLYLLANAVDTRTALGILIQSGLASLLSILVYVYVAKKMKLNEVNDYLSVFWKVSAYFKR